MSDIGVDVSTTTISRAGPWLLGLCLTIAACSSQPKPTPPSGVTPSMDSLAAADPQRSTFHGVDSRRVVAAAMTYPTATIAAEPEPPMSLTASDGTGLQLVALDAHAVVDGPLAFTELRLRFRNPRPRVIEGRFSITLPPKATISRLAMKLSTGWQEAEVVEKQLARRAYEDFLHRRQDPALLEKEAGNEFRARIFPIPANGDKDIIISYSQPLARDGADGDASYRLPLRGLPEIDHLRVRALVAAPDQARSANGEIGYRAQTLDKRGHKPTRDFEVAALKGIQGVTADGLVAALVRPDVTTAPQAIDSLVVLFDTSASRAPGFSRHVKHLGQLMAELARTYPSAQLQLAAFDQTVVPMYSGAMNGFGDAALDRVRAHRPLGASNLSAALAWAGTVQARSRVLIIGDAIPTVGPTGASKIAQAVRALAPATRRLDVLLAGGIRDQDLAHGVTRGTLAQDGVVLDTGTPAAVLARRLGQTTVSGIEVRVAGAEWVWPARLDGIQPGDEALVFAALPASDRASRASAGQVEFSLSGAISRTIRVPLTRVARPLLERAAVAAHIDRLSHERDALDGSKQAQRDAIKQRIIKMSSQYRVLSDFTALLVLETEADYQRYGIDRRALADILTVGERGVEVFHRQSPVLMIAEEPATTKTVTTKTVAKKPEAKTIRQELSKESLERARSIDADKRDMVGGMDGKDMAAADHDSDAIIDVPDAEKTMEEADERPSVQQPRPVLRPPPAAPAPPPPPPRPAPASTVTASEPASQTEIDFADDEVVGELVRPDGEMVDTRSFASHGTRVTSRGIPLSNGQPRPAPRPSGPPAYTGKMAEMMAMIERGEVESAVVKSLGWHGEKPGDVMALLALGEALEKSRRPALAARAYGSLIDLFPSRADMRRFAGERLERLGAYGHALAADSYKKAVEQRPDHLTGHRLLAYALVQLGDLKGAFAAIEAGLSRSYPSGRFAGGIRILREDLGLIAAAWIRNQPQVRPDVLKRLRGAGASLATEPSLRFVLNWETDANDVDFHIHDAQGGHAFYSRKQLPSGGELYQDVTTGYGPECFSIPGKPAAYPYHLQIHYYSRGPMGYGMGKLQVLRHDGNGTLSMEDRPFVVMNDGAYVDLGSVHADTASMASSRATIAR